MTFLLFYFSIVLCSVLFLFGSSHLCLYLYIHISILTRYAVNDETSFSDRGFAVHFSLDDLKQQGMLSSDSHEPWKRTVDPILKIARDYRQVYVTQWYPKKFGRQDSVSASGTGTGTPVNANANVKKEEKNDDVTSALHRHETVIRQVIPTRTGMKNIKSTAAVWLMSTNMTAPTIPEVGVFKAWTEDDHWSHYKEGGAEKEKGNKT